MNSVESCPGIRCFATTGALYDAAADAFADAARSAIAAHGCFDVALAGGQSPEPLYRRLATSPRREAVDWSKVCIWFSDERCVPPDHPRSNYHMARESLFDHVPLSADRIHRMRGEHPPAAAAADYARQLSAHFGAQPPRFDLIVLGVGADGHTASLFPGGAALDERRQTVCAEYVEAQDEWRMTLTLPVLDAARAIWVLVPGAAKADIVARVFHADGATEPLPAQRLALVPGALTWWLDAASAARLNGPQ